METYGNNVRQGLHHRCRRNFGQISAEWVRQVVKERGGEMMVRSSSPRRLAVLPAIHKAKTDILITLLAGAAQASYYSPAVAANQKVPMGAFVNVGPGYEHKRFVPPKPRQHVRNRELCGRDGDA